MSPPAPSIRRRWGHWIEALRHRHLIRGWTPIALAYFGLKDLARGHTVRLSSGFEFVIDDPSDAWTILQIFGRNDYRVGASASWRTVVDIGANIGAFAVLAGRAAPQARLICCEPSPETRRLLTHNLAANGVAGRVSVDDRALAGGAGPVTLFSPRQSSMRSTLPRRQGHAMASVVVEATTLETLFAEHAIDRCDFLKMDCEGAEYEVLRSAPATVLDRIDRIALEFHEWTADQDHRVLVDLLERHGFAVEVHHDTLDREIGYLFARRPHT